MTREELPRPDGDLKDDAAEDENDLSDPRHPDHDLSQWSPYNPAAHDAKPWFIRRGALLVVSFLVIIGLILPYLVRF